MSALHRETAAGRGYRDKFHRFHINHHAIDIGELVALRIDGPVIRIADIKVGWIGFISVVYPGPDAWTLGVNMIFHFEVKPLSRWNIHCFHCGLDKRVIAKLGVVLF